MGRFEVMVGALPVPEAIFKISKEQKWELFRSDISSYGKWEVKNHSFRDSNKKEFKIVYQYTKLVVSYAIWINETIMILERLWVKGLHSKKDKPSEQKLLNKIVKALIRKAGIDS